MGRGGRRNLLLILASLAVAGGGAAQTRTELVSVSTAGEQGNHRSWAGAFSPDGRFVVFGSVASNLVPGDTNGRTDVFLRDRAAGTTERVSVGSGGGEGDGDSYPGGISADGRVVAFASVAENLVEGDDNGRCDVFAHDRLTGMTEWVSRGGGGGSGTTCGAGAISPDGRWFVFSHGADGLVAGDTNGVPDVFLYDRQTGTTERVSVGVGGVEGDRQSWGGTISDDGRFVAFTSFATNLVPGDSNGWVDVFVRDRFAGTTERVSVSSTGEQGFRGGDGAALSSEGRWVAFSSRSENLVDGDTNGVYDAFVHDRWTGVTERVSVGKGGVEAHGPSRHGAVSADGRFVAFQSFATNLFPGDTAQCVDPETGYFNCPDAFVRDRATDTTRLVSVAADGQPGNGGSGAYGLSADGRFVVLGSGASNLVPGDTNSWADVFVRGPLPAPSPAQPRHLLGRFGQPVP